MMIERLYSESKLDEVSPTLYAGLKDKLRQELPKVVNEQIVLFDELADLGIISIIELLSGSVLVLEKLPSEYDGLIPNEKKILSFEDTRTSRFHPWKNIVRIPVLGADNSWDSTMVISCYKNEDGTKDTLDLLGKPSVTVRYTKDRKLTISGKFETYSGPIPQNEDVRFDILEDAFERAFDCPMPAPKEHQMLSVV